MKRITLLAWSCAAAGAAMAQQTTLPPVTVTATRTEAAPFDVPASVTVIDGERLRSAARPEINLSESVSLVPGVVARDRQNYAQDLQLSIRGFGARSTFGVRGVRLYVDGIPATMPDGQGQLSHFDLASAGRLELLRGPFSVLYGNSSGGVVQLFTDPGEGPPRLSGSLALGSDGLVRPGVRLTGATPSMAYSASLNHLGYDGYRDHSEVKRDLGNARLDFQSGEGRQWTVVANALDLRAQDPLGLTRAQFASNPRGVEFPAALQFDTRKTVGQDQVGLIHEARLAQGDRLRLMVYAGQRETTQFQAIPVGAQLSPQHPGGVIGLNRDYAGTDLRWTRRTQLTNGSLELVAGLSYDVMQEHRQGWQNFVGTTLGVQGALRRDEDNQVSNIDPYLQGVWKPAPDWTVTAGVRRSNVRFESEDHFIVPPNGNDSGSVKYGATLPVAALMYALSPQVHVYGSFGRGFETPTFNELAYRPSGAPGLNFALQPSSSDNFESGIKTRAPADALRSEVSAAVFQSNTQDEIVTQTNSGGRSTFQNAGATRRRGVELAWTRELPLQWQFQFAQTWLDARYRDAFSTCVTTPCTTPNLIIPAGNRIPGTARSVTGAELTWQATRGWRAGAELRYSSEVWVNDANTEAAPAYTTAAVHAGYVFDVKGWLLAAAARIDNLFDRHYAGSVIVNEGNGRFYEPATGRNWIVKLTGSYAF